MTKQEIMELIVGCTEKLKHVPTLTELVQITEVSHREVRKHFGGYIRALQECNLELKETGGRGHKLSLEKLFADWAAIVRKLKKLPTLSEYEMLSKYTGTPLLRRYGSWGHVPHALKQFAQRFGLAEQWKAELELVCTDEKDGSSAPPRRIKTLLNGTAYGPPLWSWPLMYAPTNELGVVFLFGVMAWRLGFVVHRLQAEFPDCEGMRQIGEDKWQRVRIEFEYESRNFLKHMHEATECDLIVCWRHNWAECPLEVLELRKEFGKTAGDRT